MRWRRSHRVAASLAVMALLMAACGRGGSSDSHAPDRFSVVAVGDIACATLPKPQHIPPRCRYDLVSELVKSLAPDRFLALGGLQYKFEGSPNYAGRYDRYFGSLKSVTRPVPGTSDWIPDPSAYFAEFGAQARPPHGYYSFDLGSWHLIALNSLDCVQGTGCGPGTPEYDWLSSDLATHPNSLYPCTLAYFYDPMFLWVNWWQKDGLPKGPDTRMLPLWAQLAGAGVDVVLGADAHNYERWAPQNADGAVDTAHGMTEFVVGTGGKRLIGVGPVPMPANLIAVQNDAFGVLRMQLMDGRMSYAWESAAQQPAFSDSGTLTCH
jgi:acid phosphatase type 7